jgi:hypothetical protein
MAHLSVARFLYLFSSFASLSRSLMGSAAVHAISNASYICAGRSRPIFPIQKFPFSLVDGLRESADYFIWPHILLGEVELGW